MAVTCFSMFGPLNAAKYLSLNGSSVGHTIYRSVKGKLKSLKDTLWKRKSSRKVL